MTVVNPKSISGITSITTASGSDNLLTIHTSDANNTERLRIDSTGTTKIVTGIVTTLTATTGIVTTFEATTGDITTLRAPTGIVTSFTTNTLTANSTTKVGSGVTLSPDGDIFATGITTIGTGSAGGGKGTVVAGGNATQLSIHAGYQVGMSTFVFGDTQVGSAFTSIAMFEISNKTNTGTSIAQDDDSNISYIARRDNDGDIGFILRHGGQNRERLRIMSDGKIGIGQSIPAALLHLTTPNGDCEMILEADVDNDNEYDNPRILFRQDGGYDQSCVGIGGTTDDSSIHNCLTLRNSTGSAGGILLMTNNQSAASGVSNHLNAVTRLKVTSLGNVEINTGNIHIGTAEKGIYFGNQVTTSASGASFSSQLFDHYEEGSWTPVLKFGGGTTGITYSARDGAYTRIGRQVTVNFMIEMTSKGSSTGTATVTGLPFPVDDLVSNTVIEASGISAYWNNFDPDMYFFGFTAETTGGGQLTLRNQPETGASDTIGTLTNSNFENDSTFRGSITYFTDT